VRKGTRNGYPAEHRDDQDDERGARIAGDVDAIRELVIDDVDWSTDGAIESAPWYEATHGKDGVRSFFAGIGETGRVTDFTPLGFGSNGDGGDFAFLRYAFTSSVAARRSRWTFTTTGGQRREGLLRPRLRGPAPVAAALTPWAVAA
jgi:hypothetical protein